MTKLTQCALGFGVSRSTAGRLLTLESVNNLKQAILEIRSQIDALKGTPVAWQAPILLKTTDEAIADLMQVEGVIKPDIEMEMNRNG